MPLTQGAALGDHIVPFQGWGNQPNPLHHTVSESQQTDFPALAVTGCGMRAGSGMEGSGVPDPPSTSTSPGSGCLNLCNMNNDALKTRMTGSRVIC